MSSAHVRAIAPGVLLAHVKTALKAPTGPLAGEHSSLFTIVLVRAAERLAHRGVPQHLSVIARARSG